MPEGGCTHRMSTTLPEGSSVEVAMADPMAPVGRDVLLTSMEYLLEARHRQLADAVTEASHRGDQEWGRRLRVEIDQVSALLHALRTEQEERRSAQSISPPYRRAEMSS